MNAVVDQMEVLFDTSHEGGDHVCGPMGTPSHMHLAGSDGSHVTTEPRTAPAISNAETSMLL